MQDFKKLQVWQKAHRLALAVYAAAATFPTAERFGIVSQSRRAAVSVAANIVEGSARGGDREFSRYLQMALSSASELQYLSILAFDLGDLAKAEAVRVEANTIEVKRMLAGLIGRLPRQSLRAES